jgi:hypothetical protein
MWCARSCRHQISSYAAGDLAVIRVDDRSGLRPASFGNSDKAQAGDVVLAVGNPLGLSSSATEGIVSATGRAVTEPATSGSPGTVLPAIQTSAPVNPGNSGGALVNTSGQVIGSPTLAATSSQNGAQAQGIGFAVPANLARDIARQLIESGQVTDTHRTAIGAQVVTVTGPDGTPAGVAIIEVSNGGAADRAGLRDADVITSRAINDRPLHTEIAGQGTVLVSPVIERITRPTVTGDGRKAPALRFGDLRVQAPAGALTAMLFTVTGITNKTLRGLMTGLLHRPCSMNQASYDLSRLARNGLIRRVPGRNRYTLTRDGLLFAHFYTKVYDHVLRPLMAPDRPNAPPELAAALDTLDQLAAGYITRARLPAAA